MTGMLLLLTLGSYEAFLLERGFKASVEPNQSLWSWQRKRVQNNAQAITILGASRIQLGLDTTVMRAQLPNYDIWPLAINGHYPMATLKGLAEDESFSGLVIMSFMAQMLEPRFIDMQAEYNDNFANHYSLYLSFDAYLTALLKSQFRFLNPFLGFGELIDFFSKNQRFPEPFYSTGHTDTSASGDYSLIDARPLKQHFIEEKRQDYLAMPPMSPDVWSEQLKLLLRYIEAIQSRGGQVVFVRFPTDDMHWELDEQYYPRAVYWDVMKQQIPQVLAIHFRDDRVLSSFMLPDSSHLDQKDAKVFTQRLIEILKSHSLIP